jgi:AraC-like DNA-binding protein
MRWTRFPTQKRNGRANFLGGRAAVHDGARTIRIPAMSVKLMARVLEQNGYDVEHAFAASSIDRERMVLTGFVTPDEQTAFDRAFVALTPGRHDLWVDLGRRHRLPAYGDFGFAMLTSPTMRHFVKLSPRARNFGLTLADCIPILRGNQLIGIELQVDTAPEDLRDFTLYRDLGAAFTCFDDIWGGVFPIDHTEVPAAASAVLHLVPSANGRIIAEDHVVRFIWRPEIGDVALFHGSPDLHEFYVERCLSGRGGNASPAGAIRRFLLDQPGQPLTLPAVAVALNMSVRTLQRRLDDEGVSFRALVQTTKMEIAKDQLKRNGASICAVATRLGYTDRSSFDLAFRRWTGNSPCHYRKLERARRAGAATSAAAFARA